MNRYPTYYKSPNNPSCIDHILTNSSKSFIQRETVFTGLSDFHKLVLSVFKLHVSKAKAKKISYKVDFKEYALQRICPFFLRCFKQTCSLKKNVVCANHAPYITKTLTKAIMKRSYLEKGFTQEKLKN